MKGIKDIQDKLTGITFENRSDAAIQQEIEQRLKHDVGLDPESVGNIGAGWKGNCIWNRKKR